MTSEDLAADIIEAWTAVETGLRSLVGGSALTGQMLIRELRQRHFLSLEQANALAEFHAARERAARTDYAPTEADINATRDAFLKLEAGLMGGTPAAPRLRRGAALARGADVSSRAATADGSVRRAPPDRGHRAAMVPAGTRRGWLVPLLAIVGLLRRRRRSPGARSPARGGSAAYDAGRGRVPRGTSRGGARRVPQGGDGRRRPIRCRTSTSRGMEREAGNLQQRATPRR